MPAVWHRLNEHCLYNYYPDAAWFFWVVASGSSQFDFRICFVSRILRPLYVRFQRRKPVGFSVPCSSSSSFGYNRQKNPESDCRPLRLIFSLRLCGRTRNAIPIEKLLSSLNIELNPAVEKLNHPERKKANDSTRESLSVIPDR